MRLKPVIVLLTGYARAGKDTFADGFEAANTGDSSRVNRMSFANSLKAALGYAVEPFFPNLSYFNEQAKIEDRALLVEFGRAMRRRDRDVFARSLVDIIERGMEFGLYTNAIVTDCRYLNEFLYIKEKLSHHFRVVTVYIETTGVGPANEEEGLSIGEMFREVAFDHQFYFRQNDSEGIRQEGARIAALYGIR
jgi:hypothetical protein